VYKSPALFGFFDKKIAANLFTLKTGKKVGRKGF
jgi:hypothetical protein